MAALEREPETYDIAFDRVLSGRARKIREDLLELVQPGMKILDLGCGPGLFALEAAKRGASVVAVDADENMIAIARLKSHGVDTPPEFIHQDVLRMGEEIDKRRDSSDIHSEYDLIVSTFLLSELKESQRDLFMHTVRLLLKEDGIFAIAAETLPKSRSERNQFRRNRRRAAKEAHRKLPPPIRNISIIVEGAGLSISEINSVGPEITVVKGTRGEKGPRNAYQDLKHKFHGPAARGRIWYNHLTGSWRGIPLHPGLYKVGNPDSESPVIVTANYELTYFTVMRTLAKDGIDAWVLICDTAGINVWCAARGVHFNSDDLVHMIRLTGLYEVVTHRELILPQLAAAGMDPTMIHERTGFRIRYGPVRIQDLSEWMQLQKPRPKSREMASVSFNLRERAEMTVAHIPFLFAAILWIPFVLIIGGIVLVNSVLFIVSPPTIALTGPPSVNILILLLQFLLALVGNAFVLGLIFPILPSKGNSFIRRGLGLATITLPIAAITMLIIEVHWTVFMSWMAVQFILSIVLTMDFAGMTSVSDPKVIRKEYPAMMLTLIIGAIFLIGFNIMATILGW